MRALLRHLRYTKLALLVFCLGMVAGFVAVVGEITRLERVASITMALGLLLVPVGLFADGRGFVVLGWLARKFSGARSAPEPARKPPPARASRPSRPRAPRKPPPDNPPGGKPRTAKAVSARPSAPRRSPARRRPAVSAKPGPKRR